MKKFLALLVSALFIVLNAAPIQNKIPASAAVALLLNTEQLLNWPLFQQMAGQHLQNGLSAAQLTTQDIQGSVALGVTFAPVQPKENMRFDAIIALKQPVAEKLFQLAEQELQKVSNVIKSKEKGKPCLMNDDMKIVLVSPKELTCQFRLGNKLKLVKLGKSKNILSKLKTNNATFSAAFDQNKLVKIFQKDIPPQFQGLIEGKVFSGITVDLLADGALKCHSFDTFKTAEACQAALAESNAQLAKMKENPAFAAIIDKIKIKTDKNTVRSFCEFSATDVQMTAGSLMMMIMSQVQEQAQAQAQGAAAPSAPAKPAAK